MRRTAALIGAVSIAVATVASTCAFAQNNSNTTKATDPSTESAQPGTAGRAMDNATSAGTSKPASGTLMQQREKGMAPESASGSAATGKMKQ